MTSPSIAATPAASPLSAGEFAAQMEAFAPFEARPLIAVAVSGGMDSMALLRLACQWALQQQGRVVALTVDHGLRPESASEAETVQRYCALLGVEHHTLKWQPPALSSALQAQAREARYRLLAGWCRGHHVLHLLTAHHQDDQAETIFFRLARGSGLDGLACMPAMSFRRHVRLLRPLLDIPKTRLQATLDACGQPWLEDPSNQSPRYTRNIIRQHLQHTGSAPRLCEEAAHLAQRFGIIRNHLENRLASYSTKVVSLFPEGYGTLHLQSFSALAPDDAMRLLSALLLAVGGAAYQHRTEKLARLYGEMVTGRIQRRRTLAGLQLVWKPKQGHFLICREADAVEPPAILMGCLMGGLMDGQSLLWDSRFIVSHGGKNPLTVAALGLDGMRRINDLRSGSRVKSLALVEKQVLASLPSFWNLEKLVAVPHIHYHHPDYMHQGCSARFIPAKALAATAFSGMNRVA